MAYFNDKFKMTRLDQSPYLFHFINGRDNDPCTTLTKILGEKKLISDRGYICFSASPITAIRKFFEVKVNSTGRPLYQPWGLGFSRDILVRDFSVRNVIYIDEAEFVPDSLLWRTDKLDVESYDFEYLREWRFKGTEFDFSTFPKEHIIVIAPDLSSLNNIVVSFDMEFTPYIDYCNGIIEEDWNEIWKREWKGISIDKLGEDVLDDYAVSSKVIAQVLDEDMVDKLLIDSPLSILTSNNKI